jgi:acylglycerol kinase
MLTRSLAQETPDGLVKPLYALGEVQWGAYRDAQVRCNKYWFYGPYRRNASMIFSWPKSELEWECQGQIKYLEPCSGCSKCGGRHLLPEADEPKNKLWWQSFNSKPTTIESKLMSINNASNGTPLKVIKYLVLSP